MTIRQWALKRLKEIPEMADQEYEHMEADDVSCSLLRELGYDDVVDEYDKIEKWFA